jgi:hypothetical protein
VGEIPLGTILPVGKQAGDITAYPPRDTKQEKQTNETKLIGKKK